MNSADQNRLEWDKMCHLVVAEMKEHVSPFVTPLSVVISHEHGESLGTGSYISLNSRRFLITNEHVATKLHTHSIGHQFRGSDNVFRCKNPMAAKSSPKDVAVALVDDDIWNSHRHDALAIPYSRFAVKHSPVEGELLFMAGYSGERSSFRFGHLFSPGTPYLTQEAAVPSEGDSHFHFALHYLPDKATSVEERAPGLPDPHGFSGSLIWNTRFVETIQRGDTWTSECASVTGIVWGWPSSSGCLIATKVEHLSLPELTVAAISAAEKSRSSIG